MLDRNIYKRQEEIIFLLIYLRSLAIVRNRFTGEMNYGKILKKAFMSAH